ncbi:antibiotic biosynthesis monooxygenase family protein [Bacillus salitolerans]|uniref:Antibiotic biosynthesis monooxygenase family protein n=1 Tax=Bacillus salitolerans TaxID=1437434 RepID=A0ABW4LVD9_9BACI
MNLYITYGTYEFLSRIKDQYENETMLLLTGEEDRAMLLHEGKGETVFKEGNTYEILDQAGDFNSAGFAVLNNIPVSDEGRSIFEYRFSQRAKQIENEPGFNAIRVLRPKNNDTYIIVTLWDDEQSFLNWQTSKAYENTHRTRGTSEGIDQPSIFPRPSYVTKYTVIKE